MLTGIVCQDINSCIGLGDSIPWDCAADRKFFKSYVKDKFKIVGRKTWETIKKYEWARRETSVISKGDWEIVFDYEGEEYGFSHRPTITLEKYLQTCSESILDYVVIGGAEIYKLAAPYVSTLYVTRLDYSTCNAAHAIVFPWIEYNKYKWNSIIFKELDKDVTVYKMDRIN